MAALGQPGNTRREQMLSAAHPIADIAMGNNGSSGGLGSDCGSEAGTVSSVTET
jgi:hypothetical protein